MRLGITTGYEHEAALIDAGVDYIEPGVAGALKPEEPEEAIMPALLAAAKRSPLQPEAYNGFLPGDLKVVGSAIDQVRVRNYLKSAFSRVKQLDGSIVVFGSGGARRVPDGFSRDEATQQIIDFLTLAGGIAGENGVTIAIEPLCSRECNILTSVAEAANVARAVNLPSVQVLSDLYHVAVDNQSYDETASAGALLKHVHVAAIGTRAAPTLATADELVPYFTAVKAAGYDGRVSIECSWQDFAAEVGEAVAAVRKTWDLA